MKALLIGLLFAMTSAHANIIVHPDINPDVLAEMIAESDLVYCKLGECTYVMDNTQFNGRLDDKLDGYHIVFKEGTFSDADTAPYLDSLREFYIGFLWYREGYLKASQ